MCVHVCCPLIGMMAYRTELVPAYIRLLRDNEAEVRIAAAGKVTKFCDIVAPQVASQHILPCVKELSTDSSQHVRAALASVIMGMAPLLGKVSCGMVISILLFCTYHALTVCRCRYLHMKL
jgi:serine/threonine-protein phosphatase 2A regulatory subunit A